MVYEFSFRTGRIIIDHARCEHCTSYACVKACSLFGANLLRITDGKPLLTTPYQEAQRRCVEDLACELYCQSFGNRGLSIVLDMFGLDEYRQSSGLP